MRNPTPRTLKTKIYIAAGMLAAAVFWFGWRTSDTGHAIDQPKTSATREQRSAIPESPANSSTMITSRGVTTQLSSESKREIENIRRELAVMEPILPGEIENDIAMDLLRRWVKIDPVAAIQFAASHRELLGRDDFASELLTEWMDNKPDDAIIWVKTMTDIELRSQLLPSVISHMVQESPADAMLLALDLRGENRERAINTLFAEWAENDIQAAITAANGLTSPVDRANAIHQIATQWAEHDPAAAMKWISTAMTYDVKSDVDFENTPLGLVMEKWAANSPQEAAQFALASARGFGRNHMLTTVAAQWAGQDPAAALQWAAAILDTADRDAIATSVITSVGESNVASAADLALTLPTGSARDQSLIMLLDRWTSSSPADVSIWATQQFKYGGDNALTSIVKAWADSDVQSLGNWLNTLPPGSPRDKSYATLAHHLGPTHPDIAALWANAITDTRLRHETVTVLGATP